MYMKRRTHTSHFVLQGRVFCLQAEELCVVRGRGGVRDGDGGGASGTGSSHLLQALVVLLQLLYLGAQLQPHSTLQFCY